MSLFSNIIKYGNVLKCSEKYSENMLLRLNLHLKLKLETSFALLLKEKKNYSVVFKVEDITATDILKVSINKSVKKLNFLVIIIIIMNF